jgi:hypothetical protein
VNADEETRGDTSAASLGDEFGMEDMGDAIVGA